MVTVGDTTKAYWYDTDAENAGWNTLNVAAIPAADETTYTYDGKDQTYQITASEWYTVTGNVQKNVGEYTVTVSLKDKEACIWSDGTTGDKTYSFTIGQGKLDTASVEKSINVSCDKTTSKVSEVTLPENWSWDEVDQSKVLEAGTEVDATAVYNGLDKENYTEESRRVTIHITKKAHTDADGDGRCDVEGCGTYIDGLGAKLAGYSLSLAGNIGVNFYMELSDAVAADEDAYMNFKLPNGTTSKVYVTGTHADGVTAKKESVTVNGESREYYVFPCEVAAKEMTADIKAQIIAGDMEGTEYTYTVKDYADYIINHAKDDNNPNGFEEETVDVAKYLLNYGGKVQKYFGYNLDKLADEGVSEDEEIKSEMEFYDEHPEYLRKNPAEVTGNTDICTFVSAYLSLKSETDLYVYVKLADGVDTADVTFAITDIYGHYGDSIKASELVTEKIGDDDCYKLTVKRIPVRFYEGKFYFKVSVGSGDSAKTAILDYGIYSYIYTAMSEKCDGMSKISELREALKALIMYQEAVEFLD